MMQNPIDHPPAGVRWRPFTNRADWLAARTPDICASEASAICDRNNFTSRFTLAHEKAGLVESGTFSPMKSVLTHAAERVIDAAFRHEFPDWQIEDPGEFTIVTNDAFPGCAATLDRILFDPSRGTWGVGEWKTWSPFRKKDWLQGPPMYIQIQVQHQLMCSGLQWARVAVLFGFNETDFRVFEIEADPAFQAANAAACVQFLEDAHAGIFPVVDASASSKATLAILAPVDDGGIVLLEDDVWEPVFSRIEEIEDTIEPLQKEMDELKAKVKQRIGTKKYAIGSGYGWTLSTSKQGEGYLKVPLDQQDVLDIYQVKYDVQKGKASSRSLTKKRTTQS